ncbi:hypothetical protein PtB15_1B387 [Puccinia triticina]|nr:hypothetical protein PtB15_1B387 [Puccinia triticina]
MASEIDWLGSNLDWLRHHPKQYQADASDEPSIKSPTQPSIQSSSQATSPAPHPSNSSTHLFGRLLLALLTDYKTGWLLKNPGWDLADRMMIVFLKLNRIQQRREAKFAEALRTGAHKKTVPDGPKASKPKFPLSIIYGFLALFLGGLIFEFLRLIV